MDTWDENLVIMFVLCQELHRAYLYTYNRHFFRPPLRIPLAPTAPQSGGARTAPVIMQR